MNMVWQVTQNDPSPYNMMVSDRGVGFIDFGDGCWNPRIGDLAIAASHVVTDPALPLGGAEHLVAGYASVIPLSALEARLLVGLMRARQSALILVNYWRAHLFLPRRNISRRTSGGPTRPFDLGPARRPLGRGGGLAAMLLRPTAYECHSISFR